MAQRRVFFLLSLICLSFYFSVNVFLFGRTNSKLKDEDIGQGNRLNELNKRYVIIYSAVAVFMQDSFEAAEESEQRNIFNVIAISAFELENFSSLPFRCCYMLQNGTFTSLITSLKKSYHGSAIRRGIQVICPLMHILVDIRGVTLTFENNMCPIDEEYYKKVMVLKKPLVRNKHEKSIAVCVKLSYGNLDAGRLVEWFEALRLFGVDRVFSHLFMLNVPARNVFKFYEMIGFAEVMDFDLPDNEISIDDLQYWNDEQVALYNCQARLLMYDYVVVIDTDELLVPNANIFKNGWRQLFDEVFHRPEVATVHFWTVYHITMWGPTNPDHSLFIGKYNNCTVPLVDREKLVYIPTKVEFGSSFTHNNTPFKGYERHGVDPKRAVIHHYRACRKEWLESRSTTYSNRGWLEKRNQKYMEKRNDSYIFYLKEETYCYDFRRFSSKEIDKLSEFIKENVRRVLSHIRDKAYM